MYVMIDEKQSEWPNKSQAIHIFTTIWIWILDSVVFRFTIGIALVFAGAIVAFVKPTEIVPVTFVTMLFPAE